MLNYYLFYVNKSTLIQTFKKSIGEIKINFYYIHKYL